MLTTRQGDIDKLMFGSLNFDDDEECERVDQGDTLADYYSSNGAGLKIKLDGSDSDSDSDLERDGSPLNSDELEEAFNLKPPVTPS